MPPKSETLEPSVNRSKSVGRRTQAQQERSQLKVEKILLATLDLLTATTAENIGTKSIARASGVSVGTLYRFFPNKEAIYYELYRRWLKENQEALDCLIEQLPADATLETFLDAFIQVMTDPQLNAIGHWRLRLAMGTSRQLAELEAQHQLEIVQRIVVLQKKFGRLPPAHLAEDVMRLQNETTIACLFSIAQASDANKSVLTGICKDMLKLLFAPQMG